MHLTDILNAINIWAQNIIRTMGYPGLGLIMFLENVFPPIPSELVLPLAGWLTLEDGARFSLLGVTIVGAIGSVAGAFFFYGLGKWFDESRVRYLLQRFGKWFLLSEDDFDVALSWFERYDEICDFLWADGAHRAQPYFCARRAGEYALSANSHFTPRSARLYGVLSLPLPGGCWARIGAWWRISLINMRP